MHASILLTRVIRFTCLCTDIFHRYWLRYWLLGTICMCSCSVPLTFTFRDVHIKYICLVYRLRQLKLKDQLVPVDLFGITLLAVVSFCKTDSFSLSFHVPLALPCIFAVLFTFEELKQNCKGLLQHNGHTAGAAQVCQPHFTISEETFWYQSLLVCTKWIFRRQTKPLSSTEHRISVKRNICICKKYCLCPRCCVVASAKSLNCSWETTKEMPTKGTEICFVQFCRN